MRYRRKSYYSTVHCATTIGNGNEASQIKWRPKGTLQRLSNPVWMVIFNNQLWPGYESRNLDRTLRKRSRDTSLYFSFAACMSVAMRAIEINLSTSLDWVNAVGFAKFRDDQFRNFGAMMIYSWTPPIKKANNPHNLVVQHFHTRWAMLFQENVTSFSVYPQNCSNAGKNALQVNGFMILVLVSAI